MRDRLPLVEPKTGMSSALGLAGTRPGYLLRLGLRLRRSLIFLETRPAQYRASLRGTERNGSFQAASGAVCARFSTNPGAPRGALGFALLAALGVVFEVFIVEKQLFACGENEFGTAIGAFQHSVDEFHGRLPQNREIE